MEQIKNKTQHNRQADKHLVDALVSLPPNTFLNCDCMELMKEMPAGFIDLAIVDPPYGIFNKKKNANMNWVKSGSGGTWASKYGKKAERWDIAPDENYFKELYRVSKHQIIWGANHFGIKTDNFIVWRKLTISESFSMGMCEFASVSCKGNPKHFEYMPQDIERFHPTQKPIALYKWILGHYAEKGYKIMDTHVGSGSSLVACIEGGFEYYGTEIDEEYYEKAKRRVERAFRQFELNFESAQRSN